MERRITSLNTEFELSTLAALLLELRNASRDLRIWR